MSTIPKIIHYCWFGRNSEPQLMLDCIASWKKYLPEYELHLWNEDNFDIEMNTFVKEAYENKKWAFVTDYVRFYALYNYGGIYMDTDVEVVKNLDLFLEHQAFTGFENEFLIPTGIIGCEKKHPWVKEIMHYYEKRSFIDDKGNFSVQPNTAIITNITREKYSLDILKTYQELSHGLVIYPKDFFCPKSYYDNTIKLTENTYTIHHFSGSWHTNYDKIKLQIHRVFIAIFGQKIHAYIIKKKHA